MVTFQNADFCIIKWHITSKELAIPNLLAANAVDENPARASREPHQKTFVKQAFPARRPQGGNSHRLHDSIVNLKPLKNIAISRFYVGGAGKAAKAPKVVGFKAFPPGIVELFRISWNYCPFHDFCTFPHFSAHPSQPLINTMVYWYFQVQNLSSRKFP